jgi:hypothetical protein
MFKGAVMQIVTDVKARLRHFSTIALGLGTSIQAAWIAMPDDFKLSLGPDINNWVGKVTAAVLLWGLIGKFIQQQPKEAP